VKALVLGGNGFIGSHLVDRLVDAGHSVRVFDRAPERYRDQFESVDYVLAAINDYEALSSALVGIDVVFHLVSTTVPATSNEDPVADVSGNLITSLRLLELLVMQKTPRLVFLSSGGTVYGVPDSVPITEDMQTQPICSYGVTKLAIERFIYLYHYLHGLDYTVLRVANPYGERQGHIGVQGVIATFMNRVLQGEDIEVWGDGSIERDYIYVGDVADACVRAAEAGANGVYNVGSGESRSINDVIESLSSAAGRKLSAIYKPGRNFDVPRILLDCSRAARELDWRPSVGLNEGMGKTWRWADDVHQAPGRDA
jgi:UDP-glucose 4-epimerase